MSLTPEVLVESLDEVIDFLGEIRAAAVDLVSEGQTPSAREPSFSSTCTQCGRAIHWATSHPNGKKVALDDRSGSYFLRGDGKAVWRTGHSDGYAYHYDGSRGGCPSSRTEDDRGASPEAERETSRIPEWQGIYGE